MDDAMNTRHIAVSVIFPVYNESENLPTFVQRLSASLQRIGVAYEVIAVDDGSTDNSYAVLTKLKSTTPELDLVRFRRNFGQTAALSAGIERARGEVIVTIDSDLENNPDDIALLLTKLNEGFDVVSGWRTARWRGAFFTRRLPSVAANKLISLISGVPLHDYGCTLKAYRASLIKDVMLYGEMHRFIPAYVAWQGGVVAEVPVSYAPRIHGASKYGFGRMPRVLLDLVVLAFLHRYLNRPMHFFGGWGLLSFALGVASGCAAIVLKVLHLRDFVSTPLPVVSALFIIVGVQLVMFGVIGEMIMRTYYESQNRRPYTIAESTR